MSIKFDFGDLEAFLAVYETRSFHAAAGQLNLSQSAVTRRVRKLEEALDSQLFERTTRQVRPTLAAKRLKARAEAILEDADQTTRSMRDESVAFAHQRGALITIATIPTVVASVLSPALSAFRAAGQTARIRILDGSANEVAEAIAEGEADLGLCSIPSLEPTTQFEALFDDTMVLAVPPEHKLAAKPTLNWTDLEGCQVILPARGTGNRLVIDEALARARLPLIWTYEVGRSGTALDLVSAGLGIAVLPRSAIDTNSVTLRELGSPEISRPIGLLTRVTLSETPAVSALKREIRACCQAVKR